MVEEVDEETFDVGAVLILQPHTHTESHVVALLLSSDSVQTAHLIGHDHDLAISQ